MLILTRRSGENLIIGNAAEVIVAIMGVKGNQVRVGIKAPKSMGVDREEIYMRKHPEYRPLEWEVPAEGDGNRL